MNVNTLKAKQNVAKRAARVYRVRNAAPVRQKRRRLHAKMRPMRAQLRVHRQPAGDAALRAPNLPRLRRKSAAAELKMQVMCFAEYRC